MLTKWNEKLLLTTKLYAPSGSVHVPSNHPEVEAKNEHLVYEDIFCVGWELEPKLFSD